MQFVGEGLRRHRLTIGLWRHHMGIGQNQALGFVDDLAGTHVVSCLDPDGGAGQRIPIDGG